MTLVNYILEKRGEAWRGVARLGQVNVKARAVVEGAIARPCCPARPDSLFAASLVRTAVCRVLRIVTRAPTRGASRGT